MGLALSQCGPEASSGIPRLRRASSAFAFLETQTPPTPKNTVAERFETARVTQQPKAIEEVQGDDCPWPAFEGFLDGLGRAGRAGNALALKALKTLEVSTHLKKC